MPATVHDRGEGDAGHRDRLVALLHELCGAELPLPGDLRIGEAGPQHHVREQIERGLEPPPGHEAALDLLAEDRKSTRLNSSHQIISYAVFCLKKKKKKKRKIYS